jgi:hypothetical protein
MHAAGSARERSRPDAMLSFGRRQQRDVARVRWAAGPVEGRLLQHCCSGGGPWCSRRGRLQRPCSLCKCITVKRPRTEMTTLASPRVEMNLARLKHPWPCQNPRPQSPELAAPNSFEPVSSLPSVGIHPHPHSFASPFALAARRDPRSLLPHSQHPLPPLFTHDTARPHNRGNICLLPQADCTRNRHITSHTDRRSLGLSIPDTHSVDAIHSETHNIIDACPSCPLARHCMESAPTPLTCSTAHRPSPALW